MRVYQALGSLARVIVVALIGVLMAACGGDDDKSGSQAAAAPGGNGGGPPAPVPPPPTPSTGTATLEWMPPSTTTDGATLTDLAGYRIYYGTDVTQLTQRIDVNNPSVSTYVVEGLTPATYYFAVTALDGRGAESARSNAGRKDIS